MMCAAAPLPPPLTRSRSTALDNLIATTQAATPPPNEQQRNALAQQLMERNAARAEEQDCSVCMERLKSGHVSVAELNCGHKFHKACLTKWIHTQDNFSSCPCCRGDVTEVKDSSGEAYLIKPQDHDHVCFECNNTHQTTHNKIIICDRCDEGCHKKCAGLKRLPKGDFNCRRCE